MQELLSSNSVNKVIIASLAPALFGLFSFSGCQVKNDQPTPVAVVGRLVEKGKPVANATVVFHPTNGSLTVRPHGRTDEKGEFRLTTFEPRDGAPVGTYRVTVELWQTLRPEGGPENRLPAKYAKPESSGLNAEVSAQSSELPVIEIKR
jgi:hypothetical protein